jgi:hypothetical protein
MKSIRTILLFGVLSLLLASCKNQEELTKRKYTQGHYHDFNLLREKSDKSAPVDSVIAKVEHPLLSEMKEQFLPSIEELRVTTRNPNPTEMLSEHYPAIAEKMDSVIARQMQKDSTWRTDTLPESIETALSSQAMIGLGTVGGLITIAEPAAIWLTIIPMIGIPFFLLISLIAAGIATAKINRGEIDARYKKWMRLWAVCMLINILLGTIVLLHFTAL